MLYTIEDLKKMVDGWNDAFPKGMLLSCDFNSAYAIRDSIHSRGCDAQEIPDNELVEMFDDEYDRQLGDAYLYAIDKVEKAIEKQKRKEKSK